MPCYAMPDVGPLWWNALLCCTLMCFTQLCSALLSSTQRYSALLCSPVLDFDREFPVGLALAAS